MASLDFWDHTAEDIRRIAPDSILFQPVASVEQHGRHLPVGTDSMICTACTNGLKERIKRENFPGIFLPLMPYGKSNEHIDYPGTITYSLNTYLSVLMDIGRSAQRSGFKKLVFINGHGGNQEVLDIVCREIRIETGLQVFALHPFVRMEPDFQGVITPKEGRVGIHAGRKETSVMLKIRPDTVKKELISEDYSVDFEGLKYIDYSGKVSFGWKTNDVTKTGMVGSAYGANPEEADRWIREVVDQMYEACVEIKDIEML